MNREELRAFLATHNVKRFIDYLNPMGITATEAFQRRMVWARMMTDDTRYVDESAFLLENKDALRRLLLREVEEEENPYATPDAAFDIQQWMRRNADDSGKKTPANHFDGLSPAALRTLSGASGTPGQTDKSASSLPDDLYDDEEDEEDPWSVSTQPGASVHSWSGDCPTMPSRAISR